jgi:hypothetical protein
MPLSFRGRHVYESVYDSANDFMLNLQAGHIALGRLSLAKAADAFFNLILPNSIAQTPRAI